MPAIVFTDDDVKTLYYLCHLGLRTDGMNNYTAIKNVIEKLPKQEPEENKEE